MRKPIKQSKRFAVFNRDNHTCQYCGKKAPGVVLEIDHKVPVSRGGDNSMDNLTTSCFDCNRGKGIKLLNNNRKIESIAIDGEIKRVFNIFCELNSFNSNVGLAFLLKTLLASIRSRQCHGENFVDLVDELSAMFPAYDLE